MFIIISRQQQLQKHHLEMSRYSDEKIPFFIENEPGPLSPLKGMNVTKVNQHIFKSSNLKYSSPTLKCLNVLRPHRISPKIDLNEEFLDYLAADQFSSDLVIATIVGTKRIGKSFLLDCFLTLEEDTVIRLMSHNSKPYINAPTLASKARNNQKIQYFDSDGQASNQSFLWLYLFSSIMLLNLEVSDSTSETDFINRLSFAKSHITLEDNEVSLPQLIIIRRDSSGKQFHEGQLLSKIHSYGLFQSDIITLNLPYPGTRGVKAQEIIDIPQVSLNKQFLGEVQSLHALIKKSKPKVIRGNQLSCKTLNLMLQPVTKSLNREGHVTISQIWNQVLQSLSVGYYNYYIRKYAEELENQFKDERPCSQYQLYKKLSAVRRKVDRKVEGFHNISGDPIFERYRQKLKEKIRSKEQLIREINSQKSKNANNEYCMNLFSNMDDQNCSQLIQQYCKSDLDDQKTEVLLENFEKVMKNTITHPQSSNHQVSAQILTLEREVKHLDQQIEKQNQMKANVVNYDLTQMKEGIKQKQKELRELETQMEKKKQLSNVKKSKQNQQIQVIQSNIEQLKSKAQIQETQIQRLRTLRDQKVKQTTAQLEKELKDQEERVYELENMVKKVKQSQVGLQSRVRRAQQGKKNTCCQVM